MQILRNRELCRMLAVMLAVMAAGSVAGFCFDWRAGCLAFLVGLLVAICAIGFAGRQYRRLRRLSACLERICAGDYSLDVRNNDEGELSILQNDIHKVTRILREQNQRLTEEKNTPCRLDVRHFAPAENAVDLYDDAGGSFAVS